MILDEIRTFGYRYNKIRFLEDFWNVGISCFDSQIYGYWIRHLVSISGQEIKISSLDIESEPLSFYIRTRNPDIKTQISSPEIESETLSFDIRTRNQDIKT